MALNFTMGDELFRTSDSGVIAGERELTFATQFLLRRMTVELRNYFGLETFDWCYGDELVAYLQLNSNADQSASRTHAAQQLSQGIRRRLTGNTRMEIERNVQDTISHWDVARNRLATLLGGDTLTIATKSYSTGPDGTLLGFEYLPPCTRGTVSTVGWSKITINPFTWFLANGRVSMRFSDERARAVYSPTLLLLHELDHRQGCMFSAPDLCIAETPTVTDVDRSVRGLVEIGQRVSYAGVSPGRRSYADSATRHTSHWVQWPSLSQLQTGR